MAIKSEKFEKVTSKEYSIIVTDDIVTKLINLIDDSDSRVVLMLNCLVS